MGAVAYASANTWPCSGCSEGVDAGSRERFVMSASLLASGVTASCVPSCQQSGSWELGDLDGRVKSKHGVECMARRGTGRGGAGAKGLALLPVAKVSRSRHRVHRVDTGQAAGTHVFTRGWLKRVEAVCQCLPVSASPKTHALASPHAVLP